MQEAGVGGAWDEATKLKTGEAPEEAVRGEPMEEKSDERGEGEAKEELISEKRGEGGWNGVGAAWGSRGEEGRACWGREGEPEETGAGVRSTEVRGDDERREPSEDRTRDKRWGGWDVDVRWEEVEEDVWEEVRDKLEGAWEDDRENRCKNENDEREVGARAGALWEGREERWIEVTEDEREEDPGSWETEREVRGEEGAECVEG